MELNLTDAYPLPVCRFKKPTISDVARLARVSEATVSLVMNNKPSIKPETCSKVRSAVYQLNYRVDETARALALCRNAKRTDAI